MANASMSSSIDARETKLSHMRPLKNVSWKEKVANDYEWFKNWGKYLFSMSRFDAMQGVTGTTSRKDYGLLYRIYNNHFPSSMFEHVTNPLNARDKLYKNFPARLRPINYLRTNIDLLLGEFLQRPIKFTIKNRGGYNRYMDALNQALQQKLQEVFQSVMEGREVPPIDMKDWELQQKTTFRDKMAIRMQRKLTATVKDYHMKRELVKCKKDYLITGEAYTFKTIMPNGQFRYHRVSPAMIDYDRSTINPLVNKSDWVVARYDLTPSETTDMFYDLLKEDDYKYIDTSIAQGVFADRNSTLLYLRGIVPNGKVPVYHMQWRARKMIKIVAGLDMDTLQPYSFEADEDYVRAPGETVTEQWKNEIYETWRIGDKIQLGSRALPLQKDLSYNGRVYSDTHAPSISVMEMGLPIQVLIMIATWKLELTIMQSKGKIIQIDQKAIPRSAGWTEERFFYHSEAKGYMVLDRSQQGVDKSWNQYHVLDMTMFEHIKQLIDLIEYLKQSWDDLLGIARQRKAQSMASDAVGNTQTAMIQSNIITDMIFYTFEEFIEEDLRGLLELNRVADAWGVKAEDWMVDDFDREMAQIDPVQASMEDLDCVLEYNTEELRKLQEVKQYLQAFLQNQGSMGTVVDVIMSETMSEVRARLDQFEAQQQAAAQQNAQNEQELQAAQIQLQKDMEEFKKSLETDYMNDEYDRKEDIEYIRGEFNTYTFQNGDVNANQVPDALEVMEHQDRQMSDHQKTMLKAAQMKQKSEDSQAKLKEQREARKSNEKLKRDELSANMKQHTDNVALKKQQLKIQAKQKAKPSK